MKAVPGAIYCVFGLLAMSGAAAAQSFLDQIEFEPIATAITQPTSIAFAPSDPGRIFVTQKAGFVRVIHNGRLLGDAFLNITPLTALRGNEQGLLDIEFHPEFQSNGYFFVHYTDNSGDNVIARYRVSGDRNRADPSSAEIILTVDQFRSNHNGGELAFGPGGRLYIGIGDGGGAGDPQGNGQNRNTLLGAVLRIDVDSANPYAIPPDNPFAGQPGARGEIYAFGLRNPWRFSFDRATGDLFIGDVGQNRVEEIGLIPAGSGGGQNFGWNLMEGSSCFEPPTGCNPSGLTLPILEYENFGPPCGGSVTGGFSYRGKDAPQLHGTYFYADFCTGRFFAGLREGDQWRALGPRETRFFISAFGEDEDGELYFADFGEGALYRLRLPRPAPAISSLMPGAAAAGGPAFTLMVLGSGFTPASELTWNGSARPTTYLDSARLSASISAADIAQPGSAEVTVRNPAPGGGSSAASFPIEAPPALSPNINPSGIVDAAAFRRIPLAPGSIAAVFGTDLSLRQEVAMAAPLPRLLGGAAYRAQTSAPPGVAQTMPDVLVESPIFFASPLQSNIQVPWELAGRASATLTAMVGGAASAAVEFDLAPFSPSLFSLDQNGAGQGAIVIAGPEGAIAAPRGAFEGSRPARAGEIVQIFATGLGAVTNPPGTGEPAPASPLAETLTAPEVTIGGAGAPVTFSGLAPGFVGLYQVNAEVSPRIPAGDAQPLLLTIAGIASNTVTVAIE